MTYSDKVVDHYNNPRNVGSLPKDDPDVGTGLVGAPECGDVMKLQIKVQRHHQCLDCGNTWDTELQESTCRSCNSNKLNVVDVIIDSKFKTFGCGSAIASSSLATEWLKGKTVDEANEIKNTQIVEELSLPPVKIHCSVIAEDAIKAAIRDYKKKQETPK
ncbi:MAG: iron-sulfur cluster assembly scaffold protein [Candidatus Yanofskybacteria bacterium]|nr:iron-sulfur cluster assembly scaffold protein [Candidatus Yanofskybacteria bacterium]